MVLSQRGFDLVLADMPIVYLDNLVYSTCLKTGTLT